MGTPLWTEPAKLSLWVLEMPSLRLRVFLITISQILKRPFIVSMGAWGQIMSPRRALRSPITGDWFSSAAPTKG